LISHLGLPPRAHHAPQRPERLLQPVTALAAYPATCLKLSGLYAISDPGHDYPHRTAWPYIRALSDAFSARRLLWASDFSPDLDWLTFPQTFGYLPMLPSWRDDELSNVQGTNLLRLLSEVC